MVGRSGQNGLSPLGLKISRGKGNPRGIPHQSWSSYLTSPTWGVQRYWCRLVAGIRPPKIRLSFDSLRLPWWGRHGKNLAKKSPSSQLFHWSPSCWEGGGTEGNWDAEVFVHRHDKVLKKSHSPEISRLETLCPATSHYKQCPDSHHNMPASPLSFAHPKVPPRSTKARTSAPAFPAPATRTPLHSVVSSRWFWSPLNPEFQRPPKWMIWNDHVLWVCPNLSH